MEVDVVLGSRGTGISATRSRLVGSLEGLRFVEQVGALGRFQRDGIVQQLGQVRGGICGAVSMRLRWSQPARGRVPMLSRAAPLETPCSRPIRPQALPMVCLYQTTSSSGP